MTETIHQFIDRLASDSPTPGGGAAVGISASLGVASVIMACRISNSASLPVTQQHSLIAIIDQLTCAQNKCLELVAADEEGFKPLARAYRLPKKTTEEIQKRQQAIQMGLVAAMEAPIQLLEEIEHVISIIEKVVPSIKRAIISDIGVGVVLLQSAMQATLITLKINQCAITDSNVAKTYQEKIDHLECSIRTQANHLLATVDHKLT